MDKYRLNTMPYTRYKRNAVLLFSFLFPIMVCLIAYAVLGIYPFGTRSSLIIDGVHQYLGLYEELANQIQSGHWQFSAHAMGFDFYSCFSYYLSSPFSLLILLLMKVCNVNEAVTIAVLIKIGLIGAIMSWYIEKKTARADIAICSGCMYALSNFVLGYYSNLMWFDCVMLLPLLAWSIEELVISADWIRYAWIFGYCIISNYYIGFMIGTFSLLYVITIAVAAEVSAKRMRIVISFLKGSLLGAGAAGSILIPTLCMLPDLPALDRIGALDWKTVYGSLLDPAGRLLFDSFSVATSADPGAANLYCGCITLLLLMLFFADPRISRKEKLAKGSLLAFYYLSFHIAALNLLLHGLHQPIGMSARFSFIFIFLLLSLSAKSWSKAEHMPRTGKQAGTVLAFALAGASGIVSQNAAALFSMLLILTYASVLMVIPQAKRMMKKVMLSVLVLCEVSVHGLFSMCHNGTANRDIYLENKTELQTLLETARYDPSYRCAILNPILRNEELMFGLNGISLFSSTNTRAMQNWMEKMGLETGNNRFQYQGSTEVLDMLLGIQVIACRHVTSIEDRFSMYPKAASGIFFDVYRNPRVLSHGYLVDPAVLDYRMSASDPFANQNALLQKMGLPEAFKTEEILPSDHSAWQTDFQVEMQAGQHRYLWIDGIEPAAVTVNGRVQRSSDWNNHLIDLGRYDKAQVIDVRMSTYVQTALIGTIDPMALDEAYRALSRHQIHFSEGKGTIYVPNEGVLFLPWFVQKGSRVLIDGQLKRIEDIAGLSGIYLSEGSHSVQMIYIVPGLQEGALLSLLSMLMLLRQMSRARTVKKRACHQWEGGHHEDDQCGHSLLE